MQSFLTVFEPTYAKTEKYLTSFSLQDPARVLFLVRDVNSRPVGHIGFANVSGPEAEVDNVLRGERSPCDDFMAQALRSLIDWAAEHLGIARVYLNVLSRNCRAIRFYERLGFAETDRVPTARQVMAGGYKIVPTTRDKADPECPTLIRMETPTRAAMDPGTASAQPRLPIS